MKKSKTVRILCMALALLLVSQFAVTAFAATSSRWTDGTYWYYVVTPSNVTATRYRENVTISSTSVYHGYGGSTNMTGYYNLTHCENWRTTLEYGNDVYWTAAVDGYDDVHSENNVYMYDTTLRGIPASAATGTYKIQTDVLNRPIAYSVYQEDEFGNSTIIYANDALAPYDFSNEITGYSA